jgi:hypothetical protein
LKNGFALRSGSKKPELRTPRRLLPLRDTKRRISTNHAPPFGQEKRAFLRCPMTSEKPEGFDPKRTVVVSRDELQREFAKRRKAALGHASGILDPARPAERQERRQREVSIRLFWGMIDLSFTCRTLEELKP